MIKALLLTGENNHDWRRTAPFMKELLQGSGRFVVTLSENPSAALQDAAALQNFDLIFVDYNGPEWSEAAKANFTAAIEGGTGLVILHASNNGFTGWTEYEKMVALAWREGTGHGQFHTFEVSFDEEHPITRGLRPFETTDELYHRLVEMSSDYHVLATAYSAPETGGSGRREPMMLTTQYGRGRVFHQVLGHVWPGGPMDAVENPGFQTTLLRGSEWAATGDVTL